MYSVLLLTVIALPLVCLSLLGCRVTRSLGRRLGAISPLFPLGTALLVPEIPGRSIPWLLLDTQLGLDATGRVFLLLTSLLWLSSGIFALGYHREDARRDYFWGFFLAAMAGNLGLILAEDLVSFYFFFALMSFASFGMIIHDGTAEVLRAGRVYLVLVVIGEILLFLGFLGAAELADSYHFVEARQALATTPTRGVVLGLLLCGLGVKAGLVPLHVWLPLAHPAAPTAASAVLSGAMIKAGLLGWLRILPMGISDFPSLGAAVMVLGLIAMYGGVLVGVLQSHPKAILAYSSISQMGVMTLAVGAGLSVSEAWPALLPAVLFYALHHALAKGALFLGVGMIARKAVPHHQRYLLALGLAIPALALAGAPWTSGALAKTLLTYSLPLEGPSPWTAVGSLIAWSAVGTGLLMARYLWQVWPRGVPFIDPRPASEKEATSPNRLLLIGWGILVLGSSGLLSVGLRPSLQETAAKVFSLPGAVSAAWPVLLATLFAVLAWWCRVWGNKLVRWAPASGDILWPAIWIVTRSRQLGTSLASIRSSSERPAEDSNVSERGVPSDAWALQATQWLDDGEQWLGDWRNTGLLMLIILATLLLFLIP